MINQNLNVNQTLPNLRTANLIDYVGPGSMRKKKTSNAAAYWQLTFALHTSSTTSSCADIGKLCVCVSNPVSRGATYPLPTTLSLNLYSSSAGGTETDFPSVPAKLQKSVGRELGRRLLYLRIV